jgi:hypothetical protein
VKPPPIDTTRRIEIAASPLKLIVLIAGAVAFVALCGFILVTGLHGKYLPVVAQFTGWFGGAFFGLCAIVGILRLFQAGDPVVTLAPEGIRDTRIAAEFVPWSAIRGVSTWEFRRQKVMVLAVDPAVEHTLTLTRAARWSRSANRALGADGLCVVATGLKTDYDTLLATSTAFARAHGGSA